MWKERFLAKLRWVYEVTLLGITQLSCSKMQLTIYSYHRRKYSVNHIAASKLHGMIMYLHGYVEELKHDWDLSMCRKLDR